MKLSAPLLVATAALAALPLAAQVSNPVSSALKQSLNSASKKMVAAAEEMPADKYSFKPTPESMSFGQLVLHVATSNQAMCHWVSGAAAAPKTELKPTSAKEDLVNLLKQSFDYCDQAVANLNDSQLGSEVSSYGGRKVSQAAMMIEMTDDWADHYSQQAAYLRLNGMLPPTARRRTGGMKGEKK